MLLSLWSLLHECLPSLFYRPTSSRRHPPPPGLRKHLINKSLQLSLSLSLSRFHKTLLDKTQSPVTSFTEKLSAIPNTTTIPHLIKAYQSHGLRVHLRRMEP